MSKKMEYLLERMMKYYFALHLGFNNRTNREQLKTAIEKFGEHMKSVSSYGYPDEIRPVTEELERSWYANKNYFMQKETFIPKLMLLSTQYSESLINRIALYHNKNL
jgi:hypothetical protein